MTTNFEVEESISLRFEGIRLDLHNCYHFIGYHHHINGRQLILTFTRSDGEWVKESDPEKLMMIHHDVTYLDINYLNETYEFPDDDKRLADISFFTADDRKTNDQIMLQGKPKNNDDIIYSFVSGYYIRIGCKTIELSTNT